MPALSPASRMPRSQAVRRTTSTPGAFQTAVMFSPFPPGTTIASAASNCFSKPRAFAVGPNTAKDIARLVTLSSLITGIHAHIRAFFDNAQPFTARYGLNPKLFVIKKLCHCAPMNKMQKIYGIIDR
jgi:hypothetical protein